MSEKDDGEVDQIGGCNECFERFDSLPGALEHYLNKHARSDLLRETLSEVRVLSECAECGYDMTPAVSVGNDARGDGAVLTIPSNCDDCIEADPICGLMVRVLSPADVLSREVDDAE